MSIEIDWESLATDDAVAQNLKDYINDQFKDLVLPDFVSDLEVTYLSLGAIPPEITIRHIGNPFDEFFEEGSGSLNHEETASPSDSEVSESEADNDVHLGDSFQPFKGDSSFADVSTDTQPRKGSESLRQMHSYTINSVGIGFPEIDTPNFFTPDAYIKRNAAIQQSSSKIGKEDLQAVLEIEYKGDMSIGLAVKLLVNYPSPRFILLPIQLRLSELFIHCLAVVAYRSGSVRASILCDLKDIESDYFTLLNRPHGIQSELRRGTNIGGNIIDYVSSTNRERIEIIQKVKIDTEVGELEQNVLRNVGKVEKFLVEQFRRMIREELAWPSWLSFEPEDN